MHTCVLFAEWGLVSGDGGGSILQSYLKAPKQKTHVEMSCKTVQELVSILQDVQDSLYRHLAKNKFYKKTQFLAIFQKCKESCKKNAAMQDFMSKQVARRKSCKNTVKFLLMMSLQEENLQSMFPTTGNIVFLQVDTCTSCLPLVFLPKKTKKQADIYCTARQ